MGCCCSKKRKLNVKIIDVIPKINIYFDDWYANSVRLQAKTDKAKKHFLITERTPPYSPPISSFDESDVDTVHNFFFK